MDIFIGSSKTGLTYAKKLKEMIEADSKGNINCILWTDNKAFKLSRTTIDNLYRKAHELKKKHGKAILLFTPDDKVTVDYRHKNAKVYTTARDNVIYELGLFGGILGQDNVICVSPRNVDDFHVLSDWNGVNLALYSYNSKKIQYGFKDVVEKIITECGYKEPAKNNTGKLLAEASFSHKNSDPYKNYRK